MEKAGFLNLRGSIKDRTAKFLVEDAERSSLLQLCGVDLRLIPAVPYTNLDNYICYSEQLAQEIGGF